MMTVVALCLAVAAMIVALRRHWPGNRGAVGSVAQRGAPPVRGRQVSGRWLLTAPETVSVMGMGALMFVPVLVPEFTPLMTVALGGTLLLAVMAMLAVERMRGVTVRSCGPLHHWQKCVGGLAVVDLGFMSIAALVMPAHGAAQLGMQSLAAATVSASAMGEQHSMTAGGVMLWAVLATWLACAAILVAPALRAQRRTGVSHATCSGLMIAAMAALVLAGS